MEDNKNGINFAEAIQKQLKEEVALDLKVTGQEKSAAEIGQNLKSQPVVIDCPKCQKENRETANFCRHCGKQLKENPVILPYNQWV